MTWILETGIQSYLYNTVLSIRQALLRTLDSLQKYVLMWSPPRAFFEQFCKIMWAHTDNRGKFRQAKIIAQIFSDIIQHPLKTISWQTPLDRPWECSGVRRSD